MFGTAKPPVVAVIWGILLFSPVALLAAPSNSTFHRLRTEHDRVLSQLNTLGDKGAPLELDDDRVPSLLNTGWKLASQWVTAYLNDHPAATARQLKTVFDGFAPKPKGVKSQYGDFLEYQTYSFDGSVSRIAPAVYVAQARYSMESSTGTFFVVAQDANGRFQPLWNIKNLAGKHYPERDEIGRWVHLTRLAYYNGPLDVKRILPLLPTNNGNSRFLVDAFQSANGGTALAQLSIWEWTGTEATPLLIKSYEHTWDVASLQYEGNTLRLETKERLQSFSSCGGCPEPKAVWTLRITPNGITDLGRRFLEPELKWADDLLSQISNGRDTTNIARSEVLEAIKSAMQELQKENKQADQSDEENGFYWGMLDSFHRIRAGTFDLVLEEVRFRFTYVLHHGKPYFTKVRVRLS